jgi:hypothetical protein
MSAAFAVTATAGWESIMESRYEDANIGTAANDNDNAETPDELGFCYDENGAYTVE